MNLLLHKKGRGIIAFAFYFAEGAPIGFIWWALPSLMRQQDIGINEIGSFTAILILPWVFKFLWAPLVDIFRSARFGFKQWIAAAQTGMCLSLIPLIFIPLPGNLTTWVSLLFFHSVCAATQDVAIDALVINTVVPEEKGLVNGWMQAGMLIGRSLFGGGLLIFTQWTTLSVAIVLMIVSIFSTMLLLLFVKEKPIVSIPRVNFSDFLNNLKLAFSSPRTWYSIAFALTAAAAFEAAGAFAGPLLTDQQIPQQSIGFFFAVPVVVSMLLGGLAGGFLSDRIGRIKALVIFLCGFVTMALLISLAEFSNHPVPYYAWMVLYSCMYFFTGMFTAASYALFMDVTNPKLGATQFSTFMAATNGCEAWVVYIAGFIAASKGYSAAFLVMCIVSLMSLLFLKKIQTSVSLRN
ncbi:MAG: MFS transporter [Chitinophagaceae bacterium]